MPLCWLLASWICLLAIHATCQGGSFRLFAGPSGGDANRHDPQRPPKHPPPRKLINAAKPEYGEHSEMWRKAQQSGAALSASLRRTHAQSPLKADKKLDLGSYHLAPPKAEYGFRTPFEEVPAGALYLKVDVFSEKSWRALVQPAPYSNVFDVRRGLIGLDFDFKQYDTLPPACQLHLSDVLYASYQRVCQRVEGHVPPRHVAVSRIEPGDTSRVLSEAHLKHNLPTDGEHVWRPGSREHEAILGTTHGKVVMHMLTDFCHWSTCRVPGNIKSRYWEWPGTLPSWYLLIELEPRKGIRNHV